MTSNVDRGELVLYIIMDPEIPIQLIYVKDVDYDTPNPFSIKSFYIEHADYNEYSAIWIILNKIYSGKVTSKILYI